MKDSWIPEIAGNGGLLPMERLPQDLASKAVNK